MTDSVTFHLATPGGGNNMVIKGGSHLTINANGVETVAHEDLTVSCA